MEDTENLRTTLTLACWSRLYEGLVAGLAHDLAGRASALHSLALVGRRGAPSEDFVLDELEAETAKLARLGEAVRALADGAGAHGAEPSGVDLGTLLPGVIDVLRLHDRFDGDELRAEISPPAWSARAPAAELTRLFLLLAADVASRGRGVIRVLPENVGSTSSVTTEIRIADSGTDMGLGAPLEGEAEATLAGGADEAVLDEEDAAELRQVIETWGCVLKRTQRGWSVELPRAESD